MKTLFAAVSAVGLLAASPAYAADKQIDLKATVAAACGLGHHVNGYDTNPAFDQTSPIVVNLADGNGQFTDTNLFEDRSFGNIWCNGPADITIEVASLAIDRNAPPPVDDTSFVNKFDLKVTGEFGGHAFSNDPENLNIDTSTESDGVVVLTRTSAGAFETGAGRYSSVNIEVLKPSNKRAVAGTYTGYVKVTATPDS